MLHSEENYAEGWVKMDSSVFIMPFCPLLNSIVDTASVIKLHQCTLCLHHSTSSSPVPDTIMKIRRCHLYK